MSARSNIFSNFRVGRTPWVEGVVASAAALELTAILPVQPQFPGEGKREGERQEFNLSPTLRVPFRWCPAGSFTMGGIDAAAMANEKPARTVRLSRASGSRKPNSPKPSGRA